MSPPSFPYLPNPDKWIDTATHPKKSSQRPLTAFNNSFATPPATVWRNAVAGPGPSTAAKRWARMDDTPHQTKQTTLKGFFTPPDTTSEPRRKAKKVGSSRLREERMNQRGSPVPRMSGKEPSQRTSEDDYWRSDELADDLPPPMSEGDRPQRRNKSTKLKYLSSPDIIDIAIDDDLPPPLPAVIPSSTLPAPRLPTPPTSRTPPIPSELERPLSEHSLTPVPDLVLDIHRRSCGQDGRSRRGRSPWRKAEGAENDPSPTKRRKKLDNVEEVTRRAVNKASRQKRKYRPLVNLSDGDSPPSKRTMPLTSIPPNAMHLNSRSPRPIRVEKYSVSNRPSEVQRMRRRFRSRSPLKPLSLEGRIAEVVERARTPRMRVFGTPGDGRSQLPIRPTSAFGSTHEPREPIRGPTPLPIETAPPTPSPPSSLPYDPSPPPSFPYDRPTSVSTPRKRVSPHHKITPPKTRTPNKPREWEEHLETLFDFPPPPQPQFFREVPGRKDSGGFIPAEMEPETLMTWSLGPVTDAAPASVEPVPTGSNAKRGERGTADPHPIRPSIHPLGKRKHSEDHGLTDLSGATSETQSVCNSYPLRASLIMSTACFVKPVTIISPPPSLFPTMPILLHLHHQSPSYHLTARLRRNNIQTNGWRWCYAARSERRVALAQT